MSTPTRRSHDLETDPFGPSWDGSQIPVHQLPSTYTANRSLPQQKHHDICANESCDRCKFRGNMRKQSFVVRRRTVGYSVCNATGSNDKGEDGWFEQLTPRRSRGWRWIAGLLVTFGERRRGRAWVQVKVPR